MKKTANSTPWNISPMPPATAPLEYSAEFTAAEFSRIAQGLVPNDMDDKWFIYLDGQTLHIHRSWTGYCIYQVEFESDGTMHRVRWAIVNRDADEYRQQDDLYDSALLNCLIRNLLLHQDIPPPRHSPPPAIPPPQKPRAWWRFWE